MWKCSGIFGVRGWWRVKRQQRGRCRTFGPLAVVFWFFFCFVFSAGLFVLSDRSFYRFYYEPATWLNASGDQWAEWTNVSASKCLHVKQQHQLIPFEFNWSFNLSRRSDIWLSRIVPSRNEQFPMHSLLHSINTTLGIWIAQNNYSVSKMSHLQCYISTTIDESLLFDSRQG